MLDEVDGGVERIVVTPLRAVLQTAENFHFINAIVGLRRILFRCSRPADSGADVPLAEMPGGVSVVAEQLRDCRATIKTEVTDSSLEAARMPASHEACSAGLACDSRGVEPVEPRPALGEAVDIGRFRIRMAVATEITVAKIIGEDENDVRFFLSVSEGCRHQKYQ